MNISLTARFNRILIIFITFFIFFNSCDNNKENKVLVSKDVCLEKLPPFNEKFNNKENIILLKSLCTCIWNRFPKNGWERKVSEKLYNGEDIGWKIKSFSTIFENNLNEFKKEIFTNNLYNN